MYAMIKKQHLRIVRAVQRVVAAAKELADAERTLKRPQKKNLQEKATSDIEGTKHGQGAQEVDCGN